jgi:hypothetical protein
MAKPRNPATLHLMHKRAQDAVRLLVLSLQYADASAPARQCAAAAADALTLCATHLPPVVAWPAPRAKRRTARRA